MIFSLVFLIMNLYKHLANRGYLSNVFVRNSDQLFMNFKVQIFYFSVLCDVLVFDITILMSFLETTTNSIPTTPIPTTPITEDLSIEDSSSSEIDDFSNEDEQEMTSKKEESLDKNKTEYDFSITFYGLILCSVCLIYMLIIGE